MLVSVYGRLLSGVLCAIQQVLISYLFLYIVVYMCQTQSPNSSPDSFLAWHPCLFSTSMSISALHISSSVPFF